MNQSSNSSALHLLPDCRHYRGDKPCEAGHDDACPRGCEDYAPQGTRVLVIKLSALGDVLRSEVVLDGIRQTWPACQVTWVTRPAGVRLLANNPRIDRLLPFDAETLLHLEIERFDVCLSLDKEPAPCALAMRVRAADKRGIGLSDAGTPVPLSAACEPYFRLGLSDRIKFHENTASYPQLICDAVGLPYQGQRYRLYPSAGDRRSAHDRLDEIGVLPRDRFIGLHTGAGTTFANKIWTPDRFVSLARRLIDDGDARVLLLGGPEERGHNAWIARRVGNGVLDAGCDHTELVYASVVQRCDAVICGDSLALHVAVAMGVPVVALFGPTCPQEIELFGRGEKIVSDIGCAPCYLRTCDKKPNCMDTIEVERVHAAVRRVLTAGPAELTVVGVGG